MRRPRLTALRYWHLITRHLPRARRRAREEALRKGAADDWETIIRAVTDKNGRAR
jgi:hypothetical protein